MKKVFLTALACVVTSMLFAKVVSVVVTPEDAQVMQNRKIVAPAQPGVYSITVSIVDLVFSVQADGYDAQQFVVNLKSPQQMRIDLQPNRKQVSVIADPIDATIYVDGKEVGTGVADFTIHKGERKNVRCILDGYDTYNKQISFDDQKDIKMSYNLTLQQNRKTVNVLVDATSVEFFVNGLPVAKGKNSASFDVYKGKKTELVVRAEGYKEFLRIISFDEDVTSYNLTQELAVDEAYAASEPGADLANKTTYFMIKKGRSKEDVFNRLKYEISEKFETLEINDNVSGWYRTIWNTEEIEGKYIRTRIELKEVPDNGDGQVKIKFLMQSQVAFKEHAKDEDYHAWDRVLKKYADLAKTMRYLAE